MTPTLKTLVLISGRGSNFINLHQKAERFSISGVLSDDSHAPGLSYARDHGIPIHLVPRSEFKSLKDFKAALSRKCIGLAPDLIALAGFMQIIPPQLIELFHGRLVNIHPSLLPKYPGLHTHQRVLDAHDSKHGCTVHFVDAGVDTGPLIAQASLAVNPEDTTASLASRVLTLEHSLYPWVIDKIALGDIRLQGRAVQYSQTALESAGALNITLSESL